MRAPLNNQAPQLTQQIRRQSDQTYKEIFNKMDSMSQDLANVKNHNKAISDTLRLRQKETSDALEKILEDQQINQKMTTVEIQGARIKNAFREQNSQL